MRRRPRIGPSGAVAGDVAVLQQMRERRVVVEDGHLSAQPGLPGKEQQLYFQQ